MAFTKVTSTLADTLNQNTTGSAATLTTARTIGGTSFDGSANIAVALAATATEATNITASANNSADETVYPTFVDGATGTQGLETDTGFTYNPSTGDLTTAGQLGGATLSLSGNATVGGNLTVTGTSTVVNTVTMNAQNAIVFEGATADNYETTLSIVDPTADHTQYLINQGGYIPVLAASTTTAISATPAELNILDGVSSTAAELNLLDGSTANSVVNSKAVVYGSSGELAGTLSTAAQTNITSLGTLTALTGGTGDLIWDTDTLVVDSSTDRVGIGTDSPSHPLHIKTSTTSTYLRLETNDGDTGYIGYTQDEGVKFATASGSSGVKVYIKDGTNDDILTVDASTGRVGIGTTSPAYLLDVAGTADVNNLLINTAQGSDGQVLTSTGSGVGWEDAGGGAVSAINNATANELVTIGSTTTELDAEANLTFDGSTLAVTGAITASTATDQILTLNSSDSNAVYMALARGDTRKGYLGFASAGDDFTIFNEISDGDFVIKGNDGGSTITAMTIDMSAGGKVGIGTTSPEQLLHIRKSSGNAMILLESVTGGDPELLFNSEASNRSGIIRFLDNGSAAGIIKYDHQYERMSFHLANSGTGELNIDSGNLGVGTASPSAKVHLYTAGAGGINLGLQNSERYYAIETNDGNLKFIDISAGSVERMHIKSDGKVGIGTATLTGLANDGTDDFAQFAIGNSDYLDDIFDDASSRTGAYIHVHHHSGDPAWGCIMVQKDVPESYPSNNAALHMYGTAAFSNTLEINSGTKIQFNGAYYPTIRNYTYGIHGAGQSENMTFVRSDTTPGENDTYVQAYLNSAGAWYATSNNTHSDIRLKDNIKDLENSLDKILQLKGRNFTLKDKGYPDNERVYLGMVAQEVEPILPEVVDIPQNPDHMWTLRYGEITALLIEGMKEQQTQIEELKSEIEELKNGS